MISVICPFKKVIIEFILLMKIEEGEQWKCLDFVLWKQSFYFGFAVQSVLY